MSTQISTQQRIDAWVGEQSTLRTAIQRVFSMSKKFGNRARIDSLPPALRKRVPLKLDADQRERPNEFAVEDLVRQVNDSLSERTRLDAGETALLSAQLKAFIAEAIPTIYKPNLAMQHFPVDSGRYPAGAATYHWRRLEDLDDGTDLGGSEGDNDEIRAVDVQAEDVTFRARSYARKIVWNQDQIEAAIFGGVPLEMEKLQALGRAMDRIIELIALQGDTDFNLTGLYNDDNITETNPTTDNWGAATADQIVADIENLLWAIRVAVDYNPMFFPDRLRIPGTLQEYMSLERAETDRTVSEMIQAKHPGIQILNAGSREDSYGDSSVPRIMAYKFDPQICHLINVKPPTLEPAEKRHFKWEMAARMIQGGAANCIPLAMGYSDVSVSGA